MLREQLIRDIYAVDESTFNEVCLSVFAYQYKNCQPYRLFVDALKKVPEQIRTYKEIPFLPIDFFKQMPVLSTEGLITRTFESSATTGSITSKRYVTHVDLYIESFTRCFEHFYGSIKEYAILALLPSYLERTNSSLVFMVNELMQLSGNKYNKFYLANFEELRLALDSLNKSKQKTILIGVTFALIDFAQQYQLSLDHTIVMETGGMKGRGVEPIRSDLHQYLAGQLGVTSIHSEYGMTELFSQAYAKKKGAFKCPAWMKVLIRDVNDPFHVLENGKTGGVNIIDLYNIDAVSFIATQDLGLVNADNSFEILGRFDNSDIRGCNLLYTN
ncbi:MAG: acyl transferase [Bacteroidetes bacterium]|nr:acyl transferase [Bacteroidota bacterium]